MKLDKKGTAFITVSSTTTDHTSKLLSAGSSIEVSAANFIQ
jgi:hypothetical protein